MPQLWWVRGAFVHRGCESVRGGLHFWHELYNRAEDEAPTGVFV